MPVKINLDEENIIKMYESGKSSILISKEFNVSKPTILKILHRNNVNVRYDSQERKYIINDKFFNILNNISCYWAGFIAADGCICKNILSIELSKIDEDHLKKFLNVCESNSILYYRDRYKENKKYEYCCAKINSKNIICDLKNNFNIIPRKSRILNPPGLIGENNIRNYIRGYFDGDGCIRNDGSLNIVFVSGSYKLIEWVKNQLKNFLTIGNPKISKRKMEVYALSFHGNRQVRKIMEWLYKDCDTNFLERKKVKYENM